MGSAVVHEVKAEEVGNETDGESGDIQKRSRKPLSSTWLLT